MKKSLIALILAATMITAGCSTAWVSTLDAILAAAAPALVDILQIIAISKGTPLNEQLASKINADAAAVKSLAADFSTASAAAGPGICVQLNIALNTYSADQQQVLALAQVSDPATQTKITLLSNLVVGTVAAITAVIPACQATTAKLAEPPLKLKTFVNDYNAILTAKTGNPTLDAATKKLKLHNHSKFVRYATAGLLN